MSAAIYKVLSEEAKTPKHFSLSSHRIHTPPPLVREILNNIDLNSKDIFVMFNLEFLVEMKELGVDMSMVTFYSDDAAKTLWAGRTGANVVTELDSKKHFDVIIGNPPYHNGSVGRAVIWNNFVEFALNSADTVAMIVPRSLARSNDYKELRDKINKGLIYLSWQGVDLSGKSNDFTEVKVDTLAFITAKDNTFLKCTTIGKTPYNRNVWFQDSFLESIINKLETVAGKNYYGVNNYAFKATKKSSTTGKVMNNMGVAKFDLVDGVVDTNVDSHRVVTSYLNNGKKHLDAVHYAAPGIGVPGKYRQIVCSSADEAQNLVSYLKSNLCVVLHWLTRTSRTIDGPQTRFIPMVDLSRSWSNEEVYAHFNLTAEEISYIEENI